MKFFSFFKDFFKKKDKEDEDEGVFEIEEIGGKRVFKEESIQEVSLPLEEPMEELAEAFEEESDEELPEEATQKGFKKELFEWLEVLITAVISVVIIFSVFFRIATIDGSSMLNTLVGADPYRGVVGDRVIITNFAYTPKNGDIVVISRNAENSAKAQSTSQGPIIKRVIAVGGQTVDIDFDTATVYVDGKALKEDYISTPTDTKYDVDFPVYVPEGSIFVLGDNRQNSLDSRSSYIGENGIIDTRYILGHAIYRIFPFNRIGRIDGK